MCYGMIPVIIKMFEKIIPVEASLKKKIRTVGVLIACVVILLFCILYYKSTLLAIDTIFGNKAITQIEFTEVNENNMGSYLSVENKKRIFFPAYQNIEYLERYFAGHLCEIEYYELSGSVIRITLLE